MDWLKIIQRVEVLSVDSMHIGMTTNEAVTKV
jgi:hypothetical protein